MLNELSDAMTQGKGKDILGKILDGLISYTVIHFKTEEQYFERYKYSETTTHKKEHAAFVKKVSEFKEGFAKGQLSVTSEVLYFLRDWLNNHIKITDKKYSAFFNENGLK
jgi:hemerythrin